MWLRSYERGVGDAPLYVRSRARSSSAISPTGARLATTIPTPSPDAPADLPGGGRAAPPGSQPSLPQATQRSSRRLRALLRILLGCSLLVAASAGISALFVRHEVGKLRSALSRNPSLNIAPGTLAPAGWGDPQTLLLVGNDQRAHTTTVPVLPHSNEMLLVRIDPSKPWISMMSIPRELWVPIYPPGQPPITTRFNYAYTAGGIPLLVSTIKQVLGLSVNHVIVIDFNQFKQAVDEMGCVYSTIDRRYYHVNTPDSEQYQEIDLQPGYQKLCGAQALQYVSYRHGDTSLVRDARNQGFLLDVKKEFGPTLVDNIDNFEQIFGQTVQTDAGLHSTTGILDLLGTLISSAGRPVRQVQFQANLLPTYDTASPQQIAASVHSFLYGGDTIPKGSTAATAHAVTNRKVSSGLPLIASSPAELAAGRAAASSLQFPLEYPRVRESLAPGGPIDLSSCPKDAAQVTCMRTYLIHAPSGTAYPAYVIVESAGLLGQYYDVQGTTWTTAPQFANPDQAVQVAGRTYDLYHEGAHLQMVAWFQHGAVYWIRNTLLDSVGNGEMLAIAEQTTPLSNGTAGGTRTSARVRLRAVTVPPPPARRSATTAEQTIGSLAGLLVLLSLPLLAAPLLLRRRDLGRLRASVEELALRESGLLAAVDAANVSPVADDPAPRSSKQPAGGSSDAPR